MRVLVVDDEADIRELLDLTLARLNRLEEANEGEYAQTIANDIRTTMQTHAGVFRTQATMNEGVVKVAASDIQSAGLPSPCQSLICTSTCPPVTALAAASTSKSIRCARRFAGQTACRDPTPD